MDRNTRSRGVGFALEGIEGRLVLSGLGSPYTPVIHGVAEPFCRLLSLVAILSSMRERFLLLCAILFLQGTDRAILSTLSHLLSIAVGAGGTVLSVQRHFILTYG